MTTDHDREKAQLEAIRKTELFAAMQSCQRYADTDEIIECILSMREDVKSGSDPEEVLHEEGFEPDYIFDLLPD